jgi:hypothetical protein
MFTIIQIFSKFGKSLFSFFLGVSAYFFIKRNRELNQEVKDIKHVLDVQTKLNEVSANNTHTDFNGVLKRMRKGKL